MKKTFALCILGVAAACGGSSPAASPTLTITSPLANATVALGTDPDQSVAVTFALANFTLATTCTSSTNCGHVHVLIDLPTSVCNPQAGVGTEKYNNIAYAGTSISAKFAACGSGAAGKHTVTLQLHDQNHNDIKDATGVVVNSSVIITTM